MAPARDAEPERHLPADLVPPENVVRCELLDVLNRLDEAARAMLDLLKALSGALTSSLHTRHELALENLALRQQVGAGTTITTKKRARGASCNGAACQEASTGRPRDSAGLIRSEGRTLRFASSSALVRGTGTSIANVDAADSALLATVPRERGVAAGTASHHAITLRVVGAGARWSVNAAPALRSPRSRAILVRVGVDGLRAGRAEHPASLGARSRNRVTRGMGSRTTATSCTATTGHTAAAAGRATATCRAARATRRRGRRGAAGAAGAGGGGVVVVVIIVAAGPQGAETSERANQGHSMHDLDTSKNGVIVALVRGNGEASTWRVRRWPAPRASTGTTARPAQWTAQQITNAFPWDTTPRYMLRDRDGICGWPCPVVVVSLEE